MGNTGFCFEALCRPDGRGAIRDLNLIGWIDDNACFEIGAWTLLEWSQVIVKILYNKMSRCRRLEILRHPREGRVGDSSSQYLEASIGALHRVLRSGVRLVCLDFDKHYPVPMRP
jgi:hypothetical protein